MNRVYLTVDTECHDIKKENIYIWGKKGKRDYGLKRILEYGREYGIPINFFVDFAEIESYGQSFIQKIVEEIKKYNQPIYLHLHPNHISGDNNRTYLWEYNSKEKKDLLITGIEYYKKEMEKTPVAFRAGRYGIDQEVYDILDEVLPGCLDLSYTGGYGNMCHVSYDTVKTISHFTKYKSIQIIPNCQFIALTIFGKQKKVGIDTSAMSLIEFEEFLQEANGRDFVLTMHSWNFIDRLFWAKKYVGSNRVNERLFTGMVKLLKKYGYTFSKVEDIPVLSGDNQEDIIYDSTKGSIRWIRSLFLNFWRFQHSAKLSRKYFKIYAMIYTIIISIFFIVLLLVL